MTTTEAAVPGADMTPHELAAALLARDDWTRERLLEHQTQRVEAILRHAVAQSPYYRETLGSEPWTRPWHELPTLSKSTLMERWDAIVTDRSLILADVEARIASAGYDGTVAPGVNACTTSGSTGRRGIFVASHDELRMWLAVNMRALARMGLRPGMRLLSIGSPSPLHMSRHVFSMLDGKPVSEPTPVSVLTPIAELTRYVQRVQPDALVGYPTVLAELADQQLRGRLGVSPRLIACGSELLSDDAVERMHKAWGIEPREGYVTTEAPMIASGTPADRDLLIHEDVVLIEVVDERGAAVPPGTPGHRVLLTNLVNRVQPLIRYELADAVTLAEPSSQPYRRISRVEGRTSEILALPGVDGDTVTIHPHRLRRAFARLPEVRVHRLHVARELLTAQIVPAPDGASDLPARVERALVEELRDAGVDLPVTVVVVDSLTRDSQRAGKFQAVVADDAVRA